MAVVAGQDAESLSRVALGNNATADDGRRGCSVF